MVESPVPQPGFHAQAPVGRGELKGRPAQDHGQRPEQHGAGLPRPEGRQPVEKRQDAIGVTGHIDQGKIVRVQGADKNERGKDKAERHPQVDPFKGGQFPPSLLRPGRDKGGARSASFPAGVWRRRCDRPSPEENSRERRAAQAREHGQGDAQKGEGIHAVS